MQFDFLLTNSSQMATPNPGNGAVQADRIGASQLRHQKAAGSFDSALESARVRHETARQPSSGSYEVDTAEKIASHSRKNRPGSTEPENSPEDGGTVQEAPLSDDEGLSTDSTAFSPDGNRLAGDAFTTIELESDLAAENTAARSVSASSPSSGGDRSAGGLTLDAAKSTPVSSVKSEPALAIASPQDDGQTGVDSTESGDASEVFQETNTGKGGVQGSPVKAQASATVAVAPATDVAINATMTDTILETDAARSEKNRHQNPAESGTGRFTEKTWTPEHTSFDSRDPLPTARVGGPSSVFSESHSGDDVPQKFGNGAGRDLETYRSEPPASEKGSERPLWSTSALQAEAGGYQESTGVAASRSGTEPEQKAAEMLLAPQRAVNGEGEATATTETSETHHPKDLRAETLSQIVNKAVFRLRNGHSEVRIDLKPETLGHVRLQIVTENYQVTLRIMAESHAAKNLIDSGIGQLKADLQAQGLRVDELEVSVANEFNDFNRHSAFADRTAQARRMPSTGRHAFQETVPAAGLTPAMENRSTAGVDCFV